MTEVWFYHLERTTVARTLPDLLSKVAGRGWRAYVHGIEETTLSTLDASLWTYSAESFLAHGSESDPNADRQPILLGTSGAMANSPETYVSVEPADIPGLDGLERALIIFEGVDEAHLTWAREQWKRMKSKGLTLSYWKQNDLGRWERVQ